MAVITTQRLEICREENHEIIIDVLILINFVMYIFISLCILQSGKSALQIWGISLNIYYQDAEWWEDDDQDAEVEDDDQDAEVEDDDKEAFKAHVEALFADVL